ncbi:HK97 family phage prohead protease [Actinoallomurus spadix]|uniref:Prohead serine protease domain-containing protein n=1 Tax=Actinoallomurus spadix TaxID=79912 RepID=A0ABN0WVH2_9ACTN|nr:HK97 family phage prohead protease [Actinoallomurus spadix]MCO5986566.1 HK97 family phage prohead protease [Actinoallomurus spadix]
MNDTERRYTRGLVEVRGDGQRSIGGYAAKFNKLSQNLGGFVERIDPAFFNKSAADGFPDVMARYNHDDNMLLGTTAGDTLRLQVDGTGLDYTVDPPSHRADVLELIARGDVRQSSFAFRAFEEDWGLTEQGFPMRTLLSGQLVDVAPVNSPAYPDTTTGLRSLAVRLDADPAEVERAAREGELRKFLSGPPPVVVDLGDAKRSESADDKTSAGTGQGATHPVLALRQRHAALMEKRRSPLEQGATHSAPSTTDRTE